MNFTNPLRRMIAVAALVSSVAGAVGAAGAAHADETIPAEPAPTEAPVEPITQDAAPGPTDDGGAAAPTTTTPVATDPVTTPAPPVATDPVTTPAPPDPEVTTPPASEAPTTTPAQSGKPPETPTQSAIATVTTTPAAVTTVVSAMASTAPQSPVATPANGSVKLTWKAPASNGGAPIDNYVVQRYTANGWVNVSFQNALGYTVGSLVNGTKYSFRIRAHNAAGWSAPSSVVSAVPRTVPSAPLSLVASPGNQSVTLSWKASASNGGAAINSYTVQWAPSAGGPWQFFGNAYSLSYKASSAYFYNGTKYYFRILANNAAGSSVPSTVVGAVPQTVPSMVPWCNVYQPVNGLLRIALKWQAPASNGAAIDYYWVEIWKNGIYYMSYKKEAYQLSGQVDVFSPGIYDVRISAHNAVGDGAYCSQSTGVY